MQPLANFCIHKLPRPDRGACVHAHLRFFILKSARCAWVWLIVGRAMCNCNFAHVLVLMLFFVYFTTSFPALEHSFQLLNVRFCSKCNHFKLGGLHKLRLQEEVGRWLSKCQQKLTKVGRWSVLCKR